MLIKKYAILMTACINPSDMIYTTITDVDIRKLQYIEALTFYLKVTYFPVIFVENTGSDVSAFFEEYIKAGRLEYLTFQGNSFDKNKGKGYGEAEILEYAVCHSTFLQNIDFIVKVTGRLKVINIVSLIRFHQWVLPRCCIQCVVDMDTFFADSRIFISTLSFIKDNFLVKRELINDTEGAYFEHILFESIFQQNDCVFYPFFLRPIVHGISGTSGQKYWEGNNWGIRLHHLQRMLDSSICYNKEHVNNTSWINGMILKIIRLGVIRSRYLLDVLKGER